MPQYDPAIAQTDPVLIVSKVLELLRTGVASPEAKAWALSCSNSGRCIPACPEGVNPRKMLALARLELRRQQTVSNPQAAQQAARDDFKARWSTAAPAQRATAPRRYSALAPRRDQRAATARGRSLLLRL